MHGTLLFIPLLLLHIPIEAHAAALHDAANKGDIAAITAALDGGASINESDGSATPLYFAVRRGHFAAAKLLIERGADVNASTTWGPPLIAAAAKRKIDLINLLLARGANPNSDLDSESALHVAAKLGCLDCVKALVEAGANVNARTSDGKTPIHLAKLNGHGEIAGYLMAHGVTLPMPTPISAKLATADVEQGRSYFRSECASCHNIDPHGSPKIGPNLWGVLGRDKASLAQISYSEALRSWKGVWTYEDLNIYLSGPMLTTPGVYMQTLGVPDETERINVIAYLRALSDKPIPLP